MTRSGGGTGRHEKGHGEGAGQGKSSSPSDMGCVNKKTSRHDSEQWNPTEKQLGRHPTHMQLRHEKKQQQHCTACMHVMLTHEAAVHTQKTTTSLPARACLRLPAVPCLGSSCCLPEEGAAPGHLAPLPALPTTEWQAHLVSQAGRAPILPALLKSLSSLSVSYLHEDT